MSTARVDFKSVHDQFRPRVLRYLARLVGECQAEDLTQSELEGFKNAEIAAILGISLDTVKIRLHRARQMLRKELDTGCSFYRNECDELACERKPAAAIIVHPRR